MVKSVLAVPMERNVKGNAAKNVATKKLKNMRINEQDKENSLKCRMGGGGLCVGTPKKKKKKKQKNKKKKKK